MTDWKEILKKHMLGKAKPATGELLLYEIKPTSDEDWAYFIAELVKLEIISKKESK